jgi:hypothetical protein
MAATTLVRARPAVVELDREADRSWVALMAPAAELAKAVASTDFVPRALRNNPAAITAAILYGDEVGIGPMQALAKIAVIDGKPYIAAEAQRALVYAAGHDLWLEELTNTRATWCARRAGSEQVTRVTFTMDDARRAGLDRKPNWLHYPRPMLSARASAELCRAVFADVIGGLAALEEASDETEDVGAARAPGPSARSTSRRSRGRRPAAVAPSAPADVADAPPAPPLPGEEELERPADDGAEPMTGPQRRRMMALMHSRGYGGNTAADRGRRLELTRDILGRPSLATSKDLTSSEADQVIDHLESMRPPDATPESPPGPAPAAASSTEQQTELEVDP